MKEDTIIKYNPGEIEAKWQQKWESDRIYSPDTDKSSDPYYNLMMFPYPSAEGLHVGNMYAFTGADVYSRYNRMLGKDVFEPIGLDGFGIHSENYALKIGRHPKEQADISEKNFYRQLRSIGNSFDWQRTVETYNPDYYKWTQWLFIQLFKAGLAYRDTALVNWCPKDLTVLSDEQVIPASPNASQGGEGKCERCGSIVEKRDLEQWFFRITKYAQRLLTNIEGLQWSEKVKAAQKNWIGKSEGAEVEFEIVLPGPVVAPPPSDNPRSDILTAGARGGSPSASHPSFKVFTTRPDTLFGATFMVLSPEHPIVSTIETDEVRKYIDEAKKKTDIERIAEGKEKTGVFSGLYAINPVNNEKIPVWIADYVLSGYGTGAIMAVPAHDERDFEFAKKYNLPVKQVILNDSEGSRDSSPVAQNDNLQTAYIGPGKLINSGEWDGLEVPKDMGKVLDSLESKGLGTRKANFHLRDWLISRQRYWGPPIPMIFCSTCQKNGEFEVEGMNGWFTVPDAELPVRLPDVSDWKPMGTGKSPLANHPEFYNTKCPNCGSDATRETDVSDTFLDSAWYFLRYPSTDIQTAPFDTERTRKWLPVNQYIGGAEHSVLHLLYSRFVTMVLHDLNFLDFEEPFTNFFAHGLIIKDGAKMSKSKGNVVVPDEYIKKYGADTLRTYLMFIGPYSDGGDFRDSGIEGMNRFIRRVWKLIVMAVNTSSTDSSEESSFENKVSSDLDKEMNLAIKRVTEDIVSFSYNTAIARIMEYYNALNKHYAKYQMLDTKYCKILILLLAPFAPHMAEELWQNLGDRGEGLGFASIHKEKWPIYDESQIASDKIVIPVQINGKRRGEIEVLSTDVSNQNTVEEIARQAISKQLAGVEIRKTIYVPGKIINFVV